MAKGGGAGGFQGITRRLLPKQKKKTDPEPPVRGKKKNKTSTLLGQIGNLLNGKARGGTPKFAKRGVGKNSCTGKEPKRGGKNLAVPSTRKNASSRGRLGSILPG